MNVSALVPKVTERRQFNFKFHKFVPQQAGCYVLTTFNNEVLYIGLTDNLHRRFAEHRENKDKRAVTIQGRAFWFYYLILNEREIFKIERTWLNAHMDAHGTLPVLNKINSPVS